MSVFRAAENRVAIVRAANTGISAFIDPFGRITARLRGVNQKELFMEGILSGAVTASAARTFYTQHGDLFAWGQVVLSCVMLLASGLRVAVCRSPSGRRQLSIAVRSSWA
jgi:apolipoprotein N-acyltransferase